MLPPGTHMVSYNAASRTGEFAPTTSFFVHLAPSQVYVRKWSPEQELLLDLPADEVLLLPTVLQGYLSSLERKMTMLQQSLLPVL